MASTRRRNRTYGTTTFPPALLVGGSKAMIGTYTGLTGEGSKTEPKRTAKKVIRNAGPGKYYSKFHP